MFKSRRFWIGLAVTVLFLGLLFYRLDYSSTWDALRSANYVYFLPALALYFIAVFFRTLRWRFLLAPLGSFKLGRLYSIVVIGYMANNLLPLRLGELVRAYYIGEREKVSASASLATIVLERVFDGLALLLFLAVAAVGLAVAEDVDVLGKGNGVMSLLVAVLLAALFVVVLAALTLVARSRGFSDRLVALAGRLPRAGPQVGALLMRFLGGLESLRSPRRQASVLLLSAPVWLAEGAMYLVVAFSFGIQDQLSALALVLAVMFLVTAAANLVLSLPSSQGGIGPFELLTKLALVLVGIKESVAVAYAVGLHLLLLVPVTLLGLAFLWRDNVSLAQLARRGRVEQASVAVPPPGGGGQ